MITLREVVESDLPVFFEHQQDEAANHMAAFTVKNPADRGAFSARWERLLRDDAMVKRTILSDGKVVGGIMKFEECGRPEVTYWIGREHWGKGCATEALSRFLSEVTVRPLYARAAKDNIGSIRVLRKCGFEILREEKGFANARGTEIAELVLELAAG